MNCSKYQFDAFIAGAWRLWAAITTLFALCCFTLYLNSGWEGFFLFSQTGPLSIREQTFACVAICWLTLGGAILSLLKSGLKPERCVAVLISALILFLYVNILRERIQYGDVDDYVRAAADLQSGTPFHARYLYPPLLATICQPLLHWGKPAFVGTFWFANIISLVAFFWLLKAALVRYGFERWLSLVVVFLFMVVNVPILRTLGYMQMNLHVTNLILLSILLFPRYRISSALSLALAAHLKASPLIIALPFFWAGGRKWILSFLVGMLAFAGVTVMFYGWAPFADFLNNAHNIYNANGINFRENSLDSFIRSTAIFWGADVTKAAIMLFKIPVLLLIFLTAMRNSTHSTFLKPREDDAFILNTVPALLVLMLLASPLVWEHHPLFVALPFLLMLKKLNNASAWVLYCFAYVLEFLIPTFDFYPWSFGRLVSPLILAYLMFKFRRSEDGDLFTDLQEYLKNCSCRRFVAPQAAADVSQKPG
ncbi:MAG: DUF2029 domain-containing protein [Erysipelotrichia bacterium]|nr:DUF2029 domain-containing protein [Erysipelotrichia bacterium]